MNEWNKAQQQKFSRFQEILNLGKQRFVEAGGDPQHYRAGFKGEDYLTDAERQEAAEIMRQMFGVTIQEGYVYCQGRSWKLPDPDQVETEF